MKSDSQMKKRLRGPPEIMVETKNEVVSPDSVRAG